MTIDDVVIQVHKMSPSEGDTIVIRFDAQATGVLIGDIRKVLTTEFKQTKAKFLFLKDGFEISKLDEAQMEEAGWIRKPTKPATDE